MSLVDYMTIQEAADAWEITPRRVQTLCSSGRIAGAEKFGRQWAIPATCEKPADARIHTGQYVKAANDSTESLVVNLDEQIHSKMVGRNAPKHALTPEGMLEVIDYKSIEGNIPDQTYDFVDLFCGAGGMSYGFHKLGALTGRYRWAGAVDIDKHSIATYKHNYGCSPINLDLGDASIEDVRSALNLNPEHKLILIGCAPCQGFSSHRKKDHRGVDSRNTLVGRFAEIAAALKPSIIIMENVPDLLAKKHWHHYLAFKTVVEDAGYNIAVDILNMADYGVPQSRFRTVLIASRDFIPTLPERTFEPENYRTVRDAIGDLPPLRSGGKDPHDPMHITSRHRKETIEILRSVPKDGGNRPHGVGPKCLDKVEGFYDVYGRLAWDKTSVTITARCRTPSCGRFTHPEQDRGLSVREAALLQGFPKDFFFEGPFDDKYKQIGNAVSPIFSTRLAGHILTLLAGQNHASETNAIDSPTFGSYSGMIAHARNKSVKKEKGYDAGE